MYLSVPVVMHSGRSPLRLFFASFRLRATPRSQTISLACIANTLIWGRGARSGSERSRESVIGHVVPTAGHIRISVVDCRPPWWSSCDVSAAALGSRWSVRHASVEATVSYNQQTTLISLSIEDASTLLVLPQYMSEPNVTLPT